MATQQELGLADIRGDRYPIDRRLAQVGGSSFFARPGKIHPAIFAPDYRWTFEAFVPRYSVRYEDYYEERLCEAIYNAVAA